ncbi:MAG TPA: alpha/beta hydrolase [Chthoniobacteraceae bacterium]|nr:alpha/beta hydrolase [Chthoniobacteraceae bacterium]
MPTKAKSFRQLFWRFARPLIAAYLLALVGVVTFQNKLIYFPTRASEVNLLEGARRVELEPWRDESGAIIGWRSQHPQSPTEARFLVLHGNAGYALHRWPYAAGFSEVLSCEVYILEYPGYGARAGSPSESSLLDAGEQALRLLKKGSALPVFVLGESIGSGVAAGVAARAPDLVSGLIMLTPLSCLDDVAAYHFPWLPVRLLLRDHYPAIEWLKKYHGPLAVTLASDDEVIPNKFGQKLFDSYAGPKRLWTKPGMHNTIHTSLDPLWWRAVVEFVRRGR